MSRPAKLSECNRCRMPILTGHDDYGLEVRAGVICLTRSGEVQAVAAGLTCWRIDYERRLWRVNRWRVLADAPLPSDYRIAAHVCGQPIPPEWAAPPDHIAITYQPTDQCLF